MTKSKILKQVLKKFQFPQVKASCYMRSECTKFFKTELASPKFTGSANTKKEMF